jgi:hypothetical protein
MTIHQRGTQPPDTLVRSPNDLGKTTRPQGRHSPQAALRPKVRSRRRRTRGSRPSGD